MMDLTNANVIQDIKNGTIHREVLMVNNATILTNALHQLHFLVPMGHIGRIVRVINTLGIFIADEGVISVLIRNHVMK